MFKSTCEFCEKLKPDCTRIRLKYLGTRLKLCGVSIACRDCREKMKGKFQQVRR
jgi:hypothetical protein